MVVTVNLVHIDLSFSHLAIRKVRPSPIVPMASPWHKLCFISANSKPRNRSTRPSLRPR